MKDIKSLKYHELLIKMNENLQANEKCCELATELQNLWLPFPREGEEEKIKEVIKILIDNCGREFSENNQLYHRVRQLT
jgi:hypothetical protein